MKEILYELRRRGVFTVVGGPWVTVREDDFVDLADVIFVGEPRRPGRGFSPSGEPDAIRSAMSRPSGAPAPSALESGRAVV